MASIYNIGKTTERHINLELEMQNIIPREEINKPFKKALYCWISEKVPAYLRTEQNSRKEECERLFQTHFYDFLVKFAKKEIGYSYRKGKNFEELQFREGMDWKFLDKTVVY